MVRKDSFIFDGVDMLAVYGIRCVAHDVVKPRMRRRLLAVPGRDGSYDYGPGRYEDRVVRLECDSRKALTRGELRELAGLLGRKGRLVLWDEPGRAYVGRMYDEAALAYIGRVGHEFTLVFVCEPFAVGAAVERGLKGLVAYEGTAETGTRVTLENTGDGAVRGVRLMVRRVV